MSFRITNNPNYDKEERERIERIRKEQEMKKQLYQSNINSYLDQIQRAIDYKQYSLTYHRKRNSFKKERAIRIVLGTNFYFYDSAIIPILDDVSNIIHSKYPQLNAFGFHHGSMSNDNHNGDYGIEIYGDLSVFGIK